MGLSSAAIPHSALSLQQRTIHGSHRCDRSRRRHRRRFGGRCILAKRGLAVALVDRGEPGQGTSYGNAGIIEANTLFPAAFPSSLKSLARDRPQAGAGGQLPCKLPAPGGPVAAGIPPQLGTGPSGRHHAGDAAAVFAGGSRARSPDGGIRRGTLPAPHRVAKALQRATAASPVPRANARSRPNWGCRCGASMWTPPARSNRRSRLISPRGKFWGTGRERVQIRLAVTRALRGALRSTRRRRRHKHDARSLRIRRVRSGGSTPRKARSMPKPRW